MRWTTAYVVACTAGFALTGFYLGATIHGAANAALPAVSGALGGFGVGWASIGVLRLHKHSLVC